MFNEGNALALLALLAWPVVVIVMFRSMSLERALIWSILGGYMMLPQISAINFPLIPAFDKVTIPNLTAFICCVAIWGRFPALMPASWIGRGLMLAFLLSPSFTVLTNLHPVLFGRELSGNLALIDMSEVQMPALPGLRFYDSGSALAQQLLLMLPFFMARQALRSAAAIRELLVALVIAGLIYAPLMLFEIRFSPQLHTMVYGFFQHDFVQAIRAGGYRPFVFMQHGLWVAFFAFMVLMAAAALWRTEGRAPRWSGAMALGAGLVLICKTLGVYMMAVLFVPLALIFRQRAHLTVCVILASIVLAYPAMRGLGWVPTAALVERLAEFNPDRAQSLGYRFDMEDRVLAHAAAKPWLGWGSWGRFFPHDPRTGLSDVVVDGMWILTIGSYGWLGYAALFGLLTLPLWSLWWQALRARAQGREPPPLIVTILALILAANLFDLLPNATLVPMTWLIAGALLGHAEEMARTRADSNHRKLARQHGNVILGHPLASRAAGAGRRSIL